MDLTLEPRRRHLVSKERHRVLKERHRVLRSAIDL